MDVTDKKIGTVLEQLNSISLEQKKYLSQLFREAPLWLMDCMTILKCDSDQVFIREGTPVDRVLIMVEGTVKAVDHRIFGIEYDYMRFYAVKMFGSMEMLLDIDMYKTTLKTVTPCIFLEIPSDRFIDWIGKDMNALRMETKSMGSYLLEQGRRERSFLFLNGMDRLMMVFMRSYEWQHDGGCCVVVYTRQELSDNSGLSVKTINRSVKKLTEDGYISRRGNKILISAEQYSAIADYLKKIGVE